MVKSLHLTLSDWCSSFEVTLLQTEM